MTAQPLEIRMAHLEGAYEQVSHRLNGIDLRLNAIDSRLAAFETRMDRRFAAMDQKFLWVIGLVLVSILLPLVQRFVSHG
jgi:hypothetical protein